MAGFLYIIKMNALEVSLVRIGVLAGLLLGNVSCSRQTEPEKIRVGYLPMVSSLAYFVAVEKGYFTEEKLIIQASPIKTSNLIAQELAAGNIDAAIELSVVPLLNTAANGKPAFRIFSTSSITAENGFDSIIVVKDSPLRTFADLTGKTIGVFPGSTAKATVEAMFQKHVPGKPIPICKQLDPSQHLSSLLNGDVDAIHAYEPTLSIALQRGCRRIQTSIYALQQQPNPIGVAALNHQWAAQNPEAAKAFLRAMDHAVRDIRDYDEGAKRILAKYTGADPEVALRMNLMPMSESTQIDRDALAKYIAILKDMGEIKNSFNAAEITVGR